MLTADIFVYLAGDSHWSKLLQVNTDTNGLRHRRCIRMCKRFSLTEHSGCRLGLNVNSRGHSAGGSRSDRVGGSGILATISSRLRRWLQSKRKYEVSPVDETAGGDRHETSEKPDGDGRGSGNNGGSVRAEVSQEDCLVITKINNYHPDLKRTEDVKVHGRTTAALKSITAISSNGKTGDHASANSRQERALQNNVSHKFPIVDISVEFVDQTSHVPRSHFVTNPLKLNQNQTPRTAIMTPTARALSRSQQLRQSRNKYMKLLQKAGQLSPGR